MEVWKPITDYANYLISNHGNVRTLYFNRLMRPAHNSLGYMTTMLTKDGKHKTHAIHRLVAIHFLAPIEGKRVVNHIDGKRDNNHVSNLEYVSNSENALHEFRTRNNPARIDRIDREIARLQAIRAECVRANPAPAIV